MMTEKENKLDAEPLINTLIEKSNDGKLDWRPTANRQQFVTSVGGATSFKIRVETITTINDFGQTDTVEVARLDMLDEKGNLLWDLRGSDVPSGKLWKLYEIARRIGNQLDDRIADALNALNRL